MSKWISLFAMLVGALAGCVTPEARPDEGVTKAPADDEKEAAAPDKTATSIVEDDPRAGERYLAALTAFNSGEFDKGVEGFTDDAEWLSLGVPGPPPVGPEGIKAFWRKLHALYKPTVGVKRFIHLGDVWVAEGVLTGTHVGKLQEIEPTHKPVGFEYVHFGASRGGKTSSILALSNALTVMNQIGAQKGDPIPLPALPEKTEIVSGEGNQANMDAYNAIADALVTGDLSGWDAVIASDARVHLAASGKTLEGLPAIKAHFGGLIGAFSDVVLDRKVLGAGDYVVSFGTASGKHTGKLGTLEATHKEAKWHFIDVVRFEDGKAVESTAYRNPMELLGQLGALGPEK